MTQKLTQKSQGPKQVDAKVEKTESKENIFSGLATFAPTLQVFWGSCNNWGQKTSVHSLHFCYPSTFVSTFFWPLNFCVVQLNFFFNLCLAFQLLCQFFLDLSFFASTFVWPSNFCANFFWPFNFGVIFLTFQLLHQLFFELSTFVSAFSNS